MKAFRWLDALFSVPSRHFKRQCRVSRRHVGYRQLIAAEVLEDRTLLAGFADPNPSDGNRFGESVLVLSNGNVVVTAPGDDAGGFNAGAVYLFDGETGNVISTLIGSSSSDYIGGRASAPTAGDQFLYEVGDSNFVVVSGSADVNGKLDAGAVTFGNGVTGVSGVVNSQNSLVGSSSFDSVGSYLGLRGDIHVLSNGNYLVVSDRWDRGSVSDAGAVTFGNGNTGVTGIITENNSLIGSSQGDIVGSDIGGGIVELTNGNYLVHTNFWQNDQGDTVEAITFGDGDFGVAGTVSSENSLVGTSTNRLGKIVVLATGNYLVVDSLWDGSSGSNLGAVTFGSGSTGVFGTVSASNSLIGGSNNDSVGGEVIALTNGNYVVVSADWDSTTNSDVGAVTFGGTNGVTGLISASNSLVGGSASDSVGSGGVVELANGNFVVVSPFADVAGILSNGAITFALGTTGVQGVVSASNSLYGSFSGDRLGDSFRNGGVLALSNGNYVVASPDWNTDRGAITLGNGATGSVGAVDETNSLVGVNVNDLVGNGPRVELTNGNYIVGSPNFQQNGELAAGAVSFGAGTTPLTGMLGTSNSLIGVTAGDRVGENVFALTDGDYVVAIPSWDDGSISDVGAVTFGNGTSGTIGIVSSTNSLVGTTTGDMVGQFIQPLSTGNVLVLSPNWNNGGVVSAGAVTFLNSASPIMGAVTPMNSLVGDSANDRVGIGLTNIALLSNGNYLVLSPNWDNGTEADAGAVTFGSGTTGILGVVSETNSLVGSTANDRVGQVNTNVVELTNGNWVLRSSRWDNGNIVDAGAATFGSGTSGITGTINENNSLVGSSTRDEIGKNPNSVVALADGNYVVRSSAWDNSGIVDAGAATFGDGTNGVSGPITSDNSLVGSTAQDQVGESVEPLGNGAYVVLSRGYDDGSNIDVGAATFGPAGTGVFGTVDAANSVIGQGTTRDLLVFVLNTQAAAANFGTQMGAGGGQSKKFLVSFFNKDGESFLREGSEIDGFTGTRINILDATVTEGDMGMTEITFRVTLDQALDRNVFFDIDGMRGSTTSEDFIDNTLFTTGDNGTIAAGSTERLITLQVRGDELTELDEEFFIVLSNFNFNSQNVTVAGFQGKGTIENDDASTFSITSDSGPENGGDLTFEISLDHPVDFETRVTYATDLSGQTATTNDLTAVTNELIFAPGVTTTSVTVSPTADSVTELNETFSVRLSNLVANGRDVSISANAGVGTITNDDATQISIDDVAAEEDAGNLKFTVTLDHPVDVDISIDYATANDSATTGDFTATSGTLDIPARSQTAEITVPITDNMTLEDEEQFFVNLSNLQALGRSVSISKSQGTGTIRDDDETELSIANQVTDEDQQTLTFQVTLTHPLDVDLTFDAATAVGTADLADFTPLNASFTIDAGQTSANVTVSITDDSVVEPAEQFTLNISNVSASGRQITLGNLQAFGEIRNDDSAQISIGDAFEFEDDGSITLQVTLDNPVDAELTIDFQTNGISASANDFTSTSGQLTFAAGETTRSIVVDVGVDNLVEADEEFSVSLSNLQAQGLEVSVLDDRGLGTIRNDDQASLTIENNSAPENAENMTFVVILSNPVDQSVRVDYATEAGTASEQDFGPVSGTLTIPANATMATIDVSVIRDGLAEGDEQFAVQLSDLQTGGRNVTIGDSRAIGTILDGGADARVSISGVSQSEDAGVMTWTVQLDRTLDVDVSVDYETATDTAGTGDFVPTNGTVTIVAGQTSAQFQVSITDDSIVEIDEQYRVQLSNINAQNRRVLFAEDQAVGMIQNNDSATVRIDDTLGLESDGEITFTVVLDKIADVDVTFDYTTVANTATNSDFMAATGMATIVAGNQSTTITLSLNDDEILEADEQFFMQLANLQATGREIQFADDRAIGTIRSDDMGLIRIADASNDEDAGSLTFVVSLDHATDEPIIIGYETQSFTANESDADLKSGTVTILPGSQTATIVVNTFADAIVEANEEFGVNLVSVSAPSGTVEIQDDFANGTIFNDDLAQLAIRDNGANEDQGAIEFTIEMDQIIDRDIAVFFATVTGTATDNDFTSTTGIVTLPAGQLGAVVSIDINPDTTFERDEQFFVLLTGLQAGGRRIDFLDARATGTIQNDDSVFVSISDVVQTERRSAFTFAVQIDSPLEIDLPIDFATANQTADTGDYVQTSGTLTILTGMTSGEIEVQVIPDDMVEPDETFQLVLNPNNSALPQIVFENSAATATIIDDDIASESGEVMDSYTNARSINGNFRRVLSGNFDQVGADGDDLLFWDPLSGQTRLILSTGEMVTNPILPTSINGNEYFEVIVGDFDEGGGDDLFFWNPFNGRNRLFHTNFTNSEVSTTFESDIIPPTAINGNDFQHFVVADFDGSGPEDLFFWSPLSGKNRLVHVDVVQVGLQSRGDNFQNDIVDRPLLNGGDFETVHAGQFDGEGVSELLFFNLRTGKNRIISLDVVTPGIESVFSDQITNNLAPAAFNGSFYQRIEVADVNGDGIDDVFAWRPGSGDNRVGLVNLAPNSQGQIRTNFIPRGSINGEFMHVVRLTEQLFSSTFRDELFFWDPITGKNRVGHL